MRLPLAKVKRPISGSRPVRTELTLAVAGCVSLAALVTAIPAAQAKQTPELQPSALRLLAKDFVAKVGGRLQTYDQEQAAKAGDNPLSQLADGELLLLRPRSGKFSIDGEIGSIKKNDRLYYSLTDIIDQLELAIDYDPEKKIGTGWFLREDWLVRMDFNKGEVVSRNTSFTLKPEDTYDEGGDLYISAGAARDWFAIETKPDFSQQYVEITTPVPYPALARNYRDRNTNNRQSRNIAELPRYQPEEQWLDLNTAEIQENIRYSKRADGPGTLNHRNITQVEGDLLKHNFFGTTLWDNEENLTSVRARLSKSDESGNLLGPLGARYYALGDVELPQLPLTGNTTSALGVRVNNNPLRNADFQSTNITGDSLPGWDVELYRDSVLIDRLRVDESARYEFPQIELFAGDNLFEIFFYGPQGEIRRDAFNIPVNEEFLATQDNTYDVSVSLSDAQTYQKFPSEDEDEGTPDIVARYNKLIGTTLAYGGVRTRQVDGEQKSYLTSGFTNIWNGFIFDGNFAVDQTGAPAGQVGIRKNIDDWRLALRANAQSEEYDNNGETPSLYGLTGNASKNFLTFFGSFATVTANGQYNVLADDTTETQASLSLAHQLGRFQISNTTSYRKSEFSFDDDETLDGTPGYFDNDSDNTQNEPQIDNQIAARYSFGRFFLRGGVNFNIRPDSGVDNYFSELTWQPTNRFSTDLELQHDPNQKYSEARLSFNYRHDKFRISPYTSYDSDQRLQAGMRLTTSLIDQPGRTFPKMTSDRVAGRGLVSSFVYLDKNGNSTFDDGDEPLPDVIVESVNVKRRAPTNGQGYSLINDLPESFVTDVRVDRATLPDPFMIPAFDGVSVFPRAGQMVDLKFPIHVAGEIDGTVNIRDHSKLVSAKRMSVNLIPIDGRSQDIVSTITADDGYYVLSSVRPGDYLLNVNPVDAARVDAGGLTPIPVRIGYDGTILSGKDFELEKGRVQVPFSIKPYTGKDYASPFFALETGDASKKSGLGTLLDKMIERRSTQDLKGGLVPIALDGENGLKVLPGADFTAHYSRCQQLNDAHMPCEMILFVPKKSQSATVTAQK